LIGGSLERHRCPQIRTNTWQAIAVLGRRWYSQGVIAFAAKTAGACCCATMCCVCMSSGVRKWLG